MVLARNAKQDAHESQGDLDSVGGSNCYVPRNYSHPNFVKFPDDNGQAFNAHLKRLKNLQDQMNAKPMPVEVCDQARLDFNVLSYKRSPASAGKLNNRKQVDAPQ